MRVKLLIRMCLVLVAVGVTSEPQALTAAPDAIFYNGKIITVDSAFHIEQAFAITGDRFAAVGPNDAIKSLAGPKTRLIDLRGYAVIPGLIDNHNHLYTTGMLHYRGVDMTGVRSLAEIYDRIRRAVAAAKPGETVFTNTAWNEHDLQEKRAPTRKELDQISLDHRIVVFRARVAAYLNSAALKAAGVTGETQALAEDPIPEPITRDAAGEPTGLIFGPSTIEVIFKKVVPAPTWEEQKHAISRMQEHLHSVGLTGVRDLAIRPDAMRAYWRLWREGKLTMRVSMGMNVLPSDADNLDRILGPLGVGPGFGDHRLRVDGIAEFAIDGIPPNAYLREPHVDLPGENFGVLRLTPERLREALLTVDRYGWRPAVHVCGDKALDVILDAYEAVNAQRPIRDGRWIVEHIPLVHPEQMERLARMGVLVAAQHQPYEGTPAMVRSWGKERADRTVPMRQLLDHGVMVSAGSDLIGPDANPFVTIYFYVTRKTETGAVSGVSEKITREEALRVSTMGNAYMTFEEDVKGSIASGKLADFVILSQDILRVPEEQIRELKPLATYVGGRKVFASNGVF